MKMMSSTRTTSTRGVTLISELMAPFPLPTAMPMLSSLDSLDAGNTRLFGHDPHAREAGLVDHHHDVLDLAIRQALVTLQGDALVGIALVGLHQEGLEIGQVHLFGLQP